VTRIATVAPTQTGLCRESAKFQARSAVTGVGFTPTESEKVLNHFVRRRILLMLMMPGNAGIVTEVSSLILYGRAADLKQLDNRKKGPSGERRHRQKMSNQTKIKQKELLSDKNQAEEHFSS
jgi:hypothetical protein